MFSKNKDVDLQGLTELMDFIKTAVDNENERQRGSGIIWPLFFVAFIPLAICLVIVTSA